MVSLRGEYKLRDDPRGMIYRVDKYLTQVSSGGVYSTKPGLLICDVHSTTWCSDIETVIRQATDARSIPRDIDSDGVYWLQVPMFPSLGVYANVFLDRVRHPLNMFSVYLNPPKDAPEENSLSAIRDEKGFNLGILCEGEGRHAIRSMIIEWLDMQWMTKEYSGCGSLTHRVMERAQLAINLKNRATALPEVYNLLFYSKCTECLRKTGASFGFDADLIPPR